MFLAAFAWRFESVGRVAGAVRPQFRRFSVYPDSPLTIEHPAAVGQEIKKPNGKPGQLPAQTQWPVQAHSAFEYCADLYLGVLARRY